MASAVPSARLYVRETPSYDHTGNKLTCISGPLQRPARAAPNWQAGQEVQQVLNWAPFWHFWRDKHQRKWDISTEGSGTGSCFANDCAIDAIANKRIHEDNYLGFTIQLGVIWLAKGSPGSQDYVLVFDRSHPKQ